MNEFEIMASQIPDNTALIPHPTNQSRTNAICAACTSPGA